MGELCGTVSYPNGRLLPTAVDADVRAAGSRRVVERLDRRRGEVVVEKRNASSAHMGGGGVREMRENVRISVRQLVRAVNLRPLAFVTIVGWNECGKVARYVTDPCVAVQAEPVGDNLTVQVWRSPDNNGAACRSVPVVDARIKLD